MGWERWARPPSPARVPTTLPHPVSARPATGARRPATHFFRCPRPAMRGSQPRTPRRSRGTCGPGIPLSFVGHFREGPAVRGGGGGGPLAPPARRRMPLSAPVLACHLTGAGSVMEYGPVGQRRGSGDGRTEDRWPRACSAAEPVVFNTSLEESRCPVIGGKIKALFLTGGREYLCLAICPVLAHHLRYFKE